MDLLERNRLIIEQKKLGLGVSALAERFSISEAMIYRVLNAGGVTKKNLKFNTDNDNTLVEYYKDNSHTLAICANKFGVSRDEIISNLKRLGVYRSCSQHTNHDEEVLRLHHEGHNNCEIGRRVGIQDTSVTLILAKNGMTSVRKHTYWDASNDEEMKRLHSAGAGIHRLAKYFHVTKDVITYRLAQLGLYAPERWASRIHETRNLAVSRRNPYEFRDKTKKLAFEVHHRTCYWKTFCDERGLPCDCETPNLGDYALAEGILYHHKIMVATGLQAGWDQDRIRGVENCVPIHAKCHELHHSELHEGKHLHYGETLKHDSPRRLCPTCGGPSTQIKSLYCRPCTAELFKSGETAKLNMTPGGLDDLRKRLFQEGLLSQDFSGTARWKNEWDEELRTLYATKPYTQQLADHFHVQIDVLRRALKRLGIQHQRTDPRKKSIG